MTETIRATAPTRVDLAGGTIDIWPACLALEPPATTVNVAVDRRAEATVARTGDGHVEVVSIDRDERVRLPAGALAHDRLGLATRLVACWGAGDGLRVTTRSRVPPGSGLGGSSALAVALAAALGRLHGLGDAPDLRRVQDVETALLKVPTGYQDYYPPRFGGVNVLHAVPGGVEREPLAGAGDFLARHMLVVDTGIEHESGLNNWEVLKRFLDGDAGVRRAFEAISACARRMRDALVARDLAGVAEALAGDWRERRRLAPVVTNARIEAIAAAARDAGAHAAKVCGAGGGGCMVVLVEDAEDGDVSAAVAAAGGRVLACAPDAQGLAVTTGG